MERRILILTLVLGAFACSGQDTNRIWLGLKIKPGAADCYRCTDFTNRRFASSFELYSRMRLSEHFFLEPALGLSDRGYLIKLTDQFGTMRTDDSFFNSPLREHWYYLTSSVNLGFAHRNAYLSVGPCLEYHVHRRWIHEGELRSTDRVTETRLQFGLSTSIGYRITFMRNFQADVHVFLSPILKPALVNYGVGIGVQYNLGNKNQKKAQG